MLTLARILCPVDFSEYSSKAYDYAYSLARHYNAKLFLQHVAELSLEIHRGYISPELIELTYEHQMAALQEQMRKLLEAHPHDKIEIETIIRSGSPADSILEFAEQHEIDLVAMGTHGRRGLDRLMVGSTTERVLRKARCAVLAIHEPARQFVCEPSQSGRTGPAPAHPVVYRFFGELPACARVCSVPRP